MRIGPPPASCRTPERSPDCWPERRHAGRPGRRPAINRCTVRIGRLYVGLAEQPRTGCDVCDCELPLSRMRRRHRARNKSIRMLELWEALATSLGTNTSSHSEQGQKIVVREIIGKSRWKYDARLARMRSSTAVSRDSDDNGRRSSGQRLCISLRRDVVRLWTRRSWPRTPQGNSFS